MYRKGKEHIHAHLAKHARADVYVKLFRGGKRTQKQQQVYVYARKKKCSLPFDPVYVYFITGHRRRGLATGVFFFTYIEEFGVERKMYRLFWSFRYISPNLLQFPFYVCVCIFLFRLGSVLFAFSLWSVFFSYIECVFFLLSEMLIGRVKFSIIYKRPIFYPFSGL